MKKLEEKVGRIKKATTNFQKKKTFFINKSLSKPCIFNAKK